VQLELSQATYLNEASGEWDDVRAQQVQGVLRELWQALRGWLTNQQEIP
jgi:N-formylglutamate amidohydrolase